MGLRSASFALAAICLAETSLAFVPHSVRTASPSKTARSLGVDPSVFQDIPHHIQHLPNAFSSMTLSDAMDAMTDAATSVAQPVADAADAVSASADAVSASVAPAVEEVAKSDNGWFGFLTEPISLLLQVLHSGLVSAGLSANSWGVSIVVLTVLIKVLTFPLTKTQLESTNKMQVSITISRRFSKTLARYAFLVP